MQKKLSLLAAFFAVLLLREKQKKPFVLTKEPNVFLIYLKIQRNVFLSICSSHANNKLGKSEQK